jgi:hypothetical protein
MFDKGRASWWCGMLVMVPLLGGCASFKATRRLDVSPFAQNTVGLIGEVQRANRPLEWVYLKKYESLPSVLDARRTYAPARELMRGIAVYSTQIVSIYESPLPESRKSQELARYLDESIRERLKANPRSDAFLTQAELDKAVQGARSAPTFMAALGAAQPVVSAALAYGNQIYDDMDQAIGKADQELIARIEAEFARAKDERERLEAMQVSGITSYRRLTEYRLGNDLALDSLRKADAEAAELLPAGKKPTAAALDGAEKQIRDRVDTIGQMHEKLDPQFAVYRAEQAELDDLRTQAREAARLGRITLITWARSHRNLANGIAVPAAIDVMSMVRSAAGQAKAVVPGLP